MTIECDVQSHIKRFQQEVLQQRSEVNVIAVSKYQPLEKIEAAIKAGQREFGENRVQEAVNKWTGLKAHYPDVVLHMIGPLQTNKVAETVQLFDVIQSVDRPKLVDVIAKECRKYDKQVACFIQVNIGQEPQKAGVSLSELPDLYHYALDKGVQVIGLMCIPPAGENPKPFFVQLKALADEYQLPRVSMGMSQDYHMAIEAGATDIRVGTAIFGARS